MQKLQSIQVLRAVAASAVVVLHAYPNPHAPIGNAGYGAFGVDLFFVISGFIMAQVAQGRSAGQFLRDRLWRIYPLWWVAVLPWLFMVPRGPLSLASSLTLWPIFAGEYYVPVLKVGWTLSFELLFYAGMTIALASRAVVPLALYALVLLAGLATASPLLHFVGSPMALDFLMGLTIAQLPRRVVFAWFIPAGLALLFLTSPGLGDVEATLTGEDALQRAIEWGLPAAMIVWGALSIEDQFHRRLFRLPVFMGDASYSVYLFHPLAAYGLSAAWPIRFVAAIALGCAMHVLVERRLVYAKRWTEGARSKLHASSKNATRSGHREPELEINSQVQGN